MINRLPIKYLLMALAVLLLLWLFLPGESSQNDISDRQDFAQEAGASKLASAIQPISDAQAALSESGIVSGSLSIPETQSFVDSRANYRSYSDEDMILLTRQFGQANEAIGNGQLIKAITSLESLIADYPSVIEPYLNLASIYSEQGQLEKARATLLKGFDANPKAGMLFGHLKSVHGAMAAESYRQALDTNAPRTNLQLKLARVSTIVTSMDQSKHIAALEEQLQNIRNPVDTTQKTPQADRVMGLEARLIEVEENGIEAKARYQQELDSLKQQLAEASQSLLLSQTAEREALARVVRAEQDAVNKVAEISAKLKTQADLLLGVQASNDAKAKELIQLKLLQTVAQGEVAAQEDARQTSITDSTQDQQLSKQKQTETAIGLVKSWARSWSAQDVVAYVKHYSNDYSSSDALSHEQWLEQRQERLTNKEFISVRVSDFKVNDLGPRFSVTFSQYYQSNTVDDTVVKRLVFKKAEGDWSKSRIVNERLVSS
jgi:tetratricopeptide (TPR) repeat protein